MIEFLSVFLGLMAGVHPVTLSASPDVASLEIRLDDEILAVLTEAPWRLDCDFGEALKPHQLVAIARDQQGRVLQRLEQWINIDLPADDGNLLTAVLIRLDSKRKLPPPEILGSWFRAGDQPVVVEKVEKGGAEVVLLRDPSSPAFLEAMAAPIYEEALQRLTAQLGEIRITRIDKDLRSRWMDLDPAGLSPTEAPVVKLAQKELRSFATLPATTVRIVSLLAAAPSRVGTERRVFHRSRRYAASTGGMLWLTNKIPAVRSHFRLADALAVSARQLHGATQRRALVVLLSQPWEDESLHQPARVRDYLRRLQTPLVVWSLTTAAPHPDWGEVVDLDKQPRKYRRQPLEWATDALRQELESQRIVWIRGRHLPQSITLSDQARGICLVGRCASPSSR